ncbi:type II toxin-antitoxin system PemK/MazF family toxin [bacterium]|nr:type II toxin-antitoxin system PemK/MazF family toxin [bacterium]
MNAPRRKSNPKRGEIYLTDFDPTRSAEIQKKRPALIIQNDLSNEYSPITIVAPITSRFNERLYPTEVFVAAGGGGLTADSVVLLNQIRAMDKRRLIRRLGALEPRTMKDVDRALTISLALIDL